MSFKPLSTLTRKEIFAFHDWLRALPSAQTSFMHNTFEPENIRKQKLEELYKKYCEEKQKQSQAS